MAGAPLKTGDMVEIDFDGGVICNPQTGAQVQCTPFSEAQMNIYRRGGLLAGV